MLIPFCVLRHIKKLIYFFYTSIFSTYEHSKKFVSYQVGFSAHTKVELCLEEVHEAEEGHSKD